MIHNGIRVLFLLILFLFVAALMTLNNISAQERGVELM